MLSITTLKANQIVVHNKGASTFFSYDTPICTRSCNGHITLYTEWNCSATTSKYRKQFLNGETTKETQKKLNVGVYTLQDYYEQ